MNDRDNITGSEPSKIEARILNFTTYAERIRCNGCAPGDLVAADKAEAARFLAVLDPGATYFTFQTFGDGGKDDSLTRVVHGSLDQRWKDLVRLNDRGAGVFVT